MALDAAKDGWPILEFELGFRSLFDAGYCVLDKIRNEN